MASLKPTVKTAPIFLQKTFRMFQEAPSDVATWNQDGTTIRIHVPHQFATSVLPKYFKHNNFLSFVRQLNFYGFRKCKGDAAEDAEWWEFHHDKFSREAPHLMQEIRRKSTPEPEHPKEIQSLKTQIAGLQTQYDSLTQVISNLTGQINQLVAMAAPTTASPKDDDDMSVVSSDDERMSIDSDVEDAFCSDMAMLELCSSDELATIQDMVSIFDSPNAHSFFEGFDQQHVALNYY
ncbi:hypothetical protein SPRG_19177 [Saprolegnia parasitica CBS 223.65]|uniref:HSF-type DNA-binding domain-containing protein n=1 Tax=Saprolegnia parasitica (strain CBS 223.65) TaxID=695850 RepID=A0A067CSN7_SAPPC|nr:hypothetical protein SPRG_19177 [Saprolegnia parasitica CBS 223.65]KDO33543.1 hypothetical protein SPRG_19177 [Saprolegnia parasitica CBS 223.65]|eukprot:XP_012195603.1 hypothetical protein SPRG_19177 [Saprolegnia parasitica CBS 223.65]